MKDQDMINILSNFNNADRGTVTTSTGEVRQNVASQEKDAMKAILEGLDAQQRSVNQMPGTHKMAPEKKGSKHPANKHFVGASAENEVADGAEELSEEEQEALDEAWLNFIRTSNGQQVSEAKPKPLTTKIIDQTIQKVWDEKHAGPRSGPTGIATLVHDVMDELKYGTVDANHNPIEMDIDADLVKRRVDAFSRFINTKSGGMSQDEKDEWDEYHGEYWGEGIEEEKFGKKKPSKDVYKKQSFSDIFKSMDEANQEKQNALARDFHNKLKEKMALKKADNGKYTLGEEEGQWWVTRRTGKIISGPYTSAKAADKDAYRQGRQVDFGVKDSEGYLQKANRPVNEEIDSEAFMDAIMDLQAHLKNIAYFGQSEESIQEEFNVNNGDTFIVLAKKIVKAVQDARKASK